MTTIPQRQLAAIVADTVQGRRRQINEMRNALARIDRLIALSVIAMETRNDGWPARRGDGGGSGSGISNPVMSQTIALSHLLELDSQIRLLFTITSEGVQSLEAKLARMASLAPQEAVKASLCSGGVGTPGVENWGRRDAHGAPVRCEDIIHANGLCAGCWSAKRRYDAAIKDGRDYQRRAMPQPLETQKAIHAG
ncbi:MAG: hypothetical protein WC054_05565 [Candidatus Nanopelagicales bacterium]